MQRSGTLTEKLAKDLNKHFTEKGYSNGKYIKRCSILLVIRSKHTETIIPYQDIPTRMPKIKKDQKH